MVRAIDKCYYCIYERVLWFFFSTFLVLYQQEFREGSLCLILLCLLCLVISFPDLLWTKPKARSVKVRKSVFLDWLTESTQSC